MSSSLNMEHSLLMDDWQLEQSLGLTLFDDPWKTVDLVSTDLKPTLADSGEESLQQLLREPTDHLADPLCEGWMEHAGIAEMLQSLVQESESMEMVTPTIVDLPDSKASWEAASTTPEVKGHEILRSLIEQTLEIVPAVSVPEHEVVPTINLDSGLFTSSLDNEPMSPIHLTNMDEIINSPLSAADVDSLLNMSEPSSPESTVSVSDTSSCSELKAMLLDTTLKANGKSRTRSTPYSRKSSTKSKAKVTSDDDDLQVEFLSKKDKKKLQNKNAAIRYRQKKKVESEVVKGEENELESKNKELQDQVDQISREIKYMKDLMTEVYKAKGVKC